VNGKNKKKKIRVGKVENFQEAFEGGITRVILGHSSPKVK